MSDIGNHKLTDALKPGKPKPDTSLERGKPRPTHATDAEQTREAQEAAEARDAEGSIRDKMVDIGRGNQQAGRQGD